MSEITMASILFPSQPCFSRGSTLKKKKLHRHHYCGAKIASSGSRNFENRISSSFSLRNSVGVPLKELPWASFDQYMEEKGRVIQAIFPEKSTSQKLNQEEWRVKMSPMQVLFLTLQPVIHVTARCISEAEDYPPEIPGHINKIFEVLITRCELEDLQADYMPLGLNINARGALYLEREGKHKWMKNQLHISLSYVVPPLLAWVPEHVLQNILQSVLKHYAEDINSGFAVRLLADYNSFKRKMLKDSV